MRTLRSLAALAGAALLLALGAPARAYDYNGTPAGSLTYAHTTAQIQEYIDDGWRPTSIDVESIAGTLGVYRVSYVRNTGSHYQYVRFEGERTWAQLEPVLDAGWRVEDLAVVGSRLSAVLIRNLVNPRTTLPFWGWTWQSLHAWLQENPSYRILDLDRYPVSGAERFSGVVIRNVGAAQVAGWGWGPDWSWNSIKDWVGNNGMRVIDLDRRADGKYAWVAVKRKPGERYYYFGGMTMSGLLEYLGGHGLRPQTIQETTVSGTRRYAGTAVNNVGAQAARLADLAAPRHNGAQGFYLRQIGGGTQVDLNGTRSMHPSSSIKVLLHYAGVRLTDEDDLNTRFYGFFRMPLVHSAMMWNSNNTMANLVLDEYGVPLIEAVGHSIIGMSQTTQIRNRFGTGGPYGNASLTTTTLEDLARVYDRVNANQLGATKTTWFRTNMLNDTNSSLFDSVLTSVRNEIGISTSRYNDYRGRIRYLFKAGSNSDDGMTGYWSCAGVVNLPRKVNGVVGTRSYVFGHYVNRSTVDYTTGFQATREILREQIRETMLTFK